MGKATRGPQPIMFTLTGTRGADTFEFTAGALSLNDVAKTIAPGASKITLHGGEGNDLIKTDSPHAAGAVPLFYDGGKGLDTIDFSNSSDAVAVQLYQGKVGASQPSIATGFTMVSAVEVAPDHFDPNDPKQFLDTTTGTSTNNLLNFENIIGSAFGDYLSLGAAAGRIDGGGGDDYIEGGLGADLLAGGPGNDFLFGKAGTDTMTGGGGADKFQVVTLNSLDVITDFNPAEDYLFVGWQENESELQGFGTWQATTWTDSNGVVHGALQSDFFGGGVILVGLTMADVAAVNAATTTFDWFG